MTTMTTMTTRSDLILDVRNAGESLIKNAGSIVGDEKYLSDLKIVITIPVRGDSIPSINISREFFPENVVDVSKEK